MDDQKPFACTVAGCTMRFTNEDHLTVHRKKHKMALNLGNGQKTNVFVADQTPTPTRFIRNCEEVGLFQDLQNVNPFEETFRKAVESSRGAQLEVDSLHLSLPTDDTLHTPHVFPNMEDPNISDLISSTSSMMEEPDPARPQSPSKDGALVPIVRLESQSPSPRSSSGELSAAGQSAGEGAGVAGAEVVRREADTSQEPQGEQHGSPSQHQQQPGQGGSGPMRSNGYTQMEASAKAAASAPSSLQAAARADSPRGAGGAVAIPASAPPAAGPAPAAPAGEAVKVLFRMPNGKFVQLSGVSLDSVPPFAQVPTAPAVVPVAAPGTVIFNTSFMTPTTPAAALPTAAVQPLPQVPTAVEAATPSGIPAGAMALAEAGDSRSRLSMAKQKLKEQLMTSKRKQTPSPGLDQGPAPKMMAVAKRIVREPSSEDGSAPMPSQEPKSSESSAVATGETGEKGESADQRRKRMRENNRLAAMKCRQRHKYWVRDLERRAFAAELANKALEAEIAQLRQEAMELKALLLQHKNCPVTLAMNANGVTLSLPNPVPKAPAPKPPPPLLPVEIRPNPNSSLISPEDAAKRVMLYTKPASLKSRRQAAASLAVTTPLSVSKRPPQPQQLQQQQQQQQQQKRDLKPDGRVKSLSGAMDLSAAATRLVPSNVRFRPLTTLGKTSGCIISVTDPDNNQLFTVPTPTLLQHLVTAPGAGASPCALNVATANPQMIKPNPKVNVVKDKTGTVTSGADDKGDVIVLSVQPHQENT